MFEFYNLYFSYKQKEVLRDFSGVVNPGETICLFGKNGSGKSTLLKILSGFYAPKKGKIHFNQQNILSERGKVKASFRAQIGFLFQDFSSDEKLSARENFEYAARLYGLSGAQKEKRIENLLRQARLEGNDDPLKKYSGGMRRRLEIYRLFLHEPKIILLDEPSAGLDFSETKRFFTFLKNYQKEKNASIIFTTHQGFDFKYCDKIWHLENGHLKNEWDPKEIFAQNYFFCCDFELKDHQENKKFLEKFFDQKNLQKDQEKFRARLSQKQIQNLLSDQNFFSHVKNFSLSEPDIDQLLRQPQLFFGEDNDQRG